MPKLLVVDDEPIIIQLLGFYFRSRGFTVVTTLNGEEALALVSIEHPDAIILDLMLPGMSGYDVCRLLRAAPATAHLPILVYSAALTTSEAVMEVGANVFLPKHTPMAKLLEAVLKLLEPSSPSSPRPPSRQYE